MEISNEKHTIYGWRELRFECDVVGFKIDRSSKYDAVVVTTYDVYTGI